MRTLRLTVALCMSANVNIYFTHGCVLKNNFKYNIGINKTCNRTKKERGSTVSLDGILGALRLTLFSLMDRKNRFTALDGNSRRILTKRTTITT